MIQLVEQNASLECVAELAKSFDQTVAELAKSFAGVGRVRSPKFLANSATEYWYEILGEFRYTETIALA